MSSAVEQFHPAEDRENVMRSSDIVVPFLIERWRPRSVLDLGCNTGAWIQSFLKLGVPATGVDGSGVGANIEHDLRDPLDLNMRFDLVLCLEVGEHLPEQCADTLVDTAIRHAKHAVIWSAATPGQGGWEHINEQPHEYWVKKFEARGCKATPLTEILPPIPHDYYRRNMWEFVP